MSTRKKADSNTTKKKGGDKKDSKKGKKDGKPKQLKPPAKSDNTGDRNPSPRFKKETAV